MSVLYIYFKLYAFLYIDGLNTQGILFQQTLCGGNLVKKVVRSIKVITNNTQKILNIYKHIGNKFCRKYQIYVHTCTYIIFIHEENQNNNYTNKIGK